MVQWSRFVWTLGPLGHQLYPIFLWSVIIFPLQTAGNCTYIMFVGISKNHPIELCHYMAIPRCILSVFTPNIVMLWLFVILHDISPLYLRHIDNKMSITAAMYRPIPMYHKNVDILMQMDAVIVYTILWFNLDIYMGILWVIVSIFPIHHIEIRSLNHE